MSDLPYQVCKLLNLNEPYLRVFDNKVTLDFGDDASDELMNNLYNKFRQAIDTGPDFNMVRIYLEDDEIKVVKISEEEYFK